MIRGFLSNHNDITLHYFARKFVPIFVGAITHGNVFQKHTLNIVYDFKQLFLFQETIEALLTIFFVTIASYGIEILVWTLFDSRDEQPCNKIGEISGHFVYGTPQKGSEGEHDKKGRYNNKQMYKRGHMKN